MNLQTALMCKFNECAINQPDTGLYNRDLGTALWKPPQRNPSGPERLAKRIRAVAPGPIPVHSVGPKASRTAAVREPEKEVTQTLSIAPQSRSTRIKGSTALSRLGSMLIRASGKAKSNSSRRGIGSGRRQKNPTRQSRQLGL